MRLAMRLTLLEREFFSSWAACDHRVFSLETRVSACHKVFKHFNVFMVKMKTRVLVTKLEFCSDRELQRFLSK